MVKAGSRTSAEIASSGSIRPEPATKNHSFSAPDTHKNVSSASAVPAVTQAFVIIDALTQSHRALRLSELVRQTGLPKTTAFRLLKTLTDLDVVRQKEQGFYLGARLAQYSSASVPAHTDLIGLFYALIDPVHKEFDETIQLGVLTALDVTFLAFVDTSRPVRLATRAGRRLPAHASATGKAILAFSPDEVVQDVLSSEMAAFTPYTVTDADALLRQLKQVKVRGWAKESQESTHNLSCVAVPVLDPSGIAKAAVTACVAQPIIPAARQQNLAAALTKVANQLSQRMHN